MSQTHFRTCNLCEAMCGLKITYEGNDIQRIEGDKEDKFSRGHICPKAFGLKDIYEDPDRLKRPIKKVNGEWKEISWQAAYEEIADNIIEINVKYGPDSIGIYQGNPSVHNLGTSLTATKFFRSLRTKNVYSASSIDQIPHHFAAWQMFGHPLLEAIPDIDNTQLFVIVGGNPLVSNGSMMTVPDVGNRLKAIQKRGGKVIVIDPRRTETAEKADQHIFINPGSDSWLFAGILKHIFNEGLDNLAHLEAYTDGLAIVKKSIEAIDFDTVEKNTGIDIGTIKSLAVEIATTEKAAVYGRMGVSTQAFGGLGKWLINVINMVTGNLDKVGGLLFTKPVIDFIGNSKPKNRYNRWQSRVRKFPEFLGELPVACLSEEIETEGPGQIKMMMLSCGNPVLSITNGKRLDKAMEKLDYMVSFDIYLNETSKHANIILPPATGVETSHYDLTFNVLAVRNVSKYSPALFEKSEGSKYDWEIFQELGQVLAKKAGVENPAGGKIFSPEEMLAMSFAHNAYKLDFEELMKMEHGIDLGPLKPQLPERLKNEKKRIELAPELLIKDFQRLLKSGKKKDGYLLIGKRHLRDNNSWMHNSEQLQKGKNRCVVLINPADAAKEGIEAGSQIKVSSRVGEVQIEARISDEMMPGVLSIPHGYGHHKKGIQLSVAEQNPGVSVNDLTDDLLIDELTGNAAFSNVYVQLKRA
jgi:anaerobic selenocysteine-containing dehydrogenase